MSEHAEKLKEIIARRTAERDAAVRAADELREALRAVLDCKGAFNGTVSEHGGAPALCTKCAALARSVLGATDGENRTEGERG